MKRCLECGCEVPPGEYFCSDSCWDIWSYGDGGTRLNEAGSSMLAFPQVRTGDGRRRVKQWEPPSVAMPGDPVDFDNLPF